MSKSSNSNRGQIASHILSNSSNMVGVCITIIALFRVLNVSLTTYTDEILSLNTLIFIFATLFSYSSLRNNNNQRLEAIADVFFFLGLFIIVFVNI